MANVLDVDIVGNEGVLAEVKRQISPIAAGEVRLYHHRGAGGEAGIHGIITSLLPPVVPRVFEILKPLVARDRNLKIVINGLELAVRDIHEASQVLELLQAHGLLPKEE